MNVAKITTCKKIIYYRDQQGKEPFAEWINSLKDKVIKVRIKKTQNKDIKKAKKYWEQYNE